MLNTPTITTSPHRYWAPRHLQAMAYLYGVEAPNLAQARILELGCGTGDNLLPLAYAYPQAQLTGIDIEQDKIHSGQQHLQQQKLTNIQLYHADINVLLNSQLDEYDYILIRGLFAQTDLATRTALLSHCQQHLSHNGLICIGYDVYPGSKLKDGLYEALAFHAAQATTEEEQVQSMKGMQAFMQEGLSSKHPYANQLSSQLNNLDSKTDEQLYVEALAGLNNPCYFVEFANTLADAELCYVGDAQANTELAEYWGNHTATLCNTINPSGQKILGQQYLDFLCGRSSRMSLLTHKNTPTAISAEPMMERLLDLRWAGYFERITSNENSSSYNHKTANLEIVNTKDKTTLAILDALGFVYPFSLDANHLLINTRDGLDIINNDISAFDDLKKSLKAIFTHLGDKIHLSCEETPYDISANKQLLPHVHPTAPTPQHVTNDPKYSTYINLWHESVANLNLPLVSQQLNTIYSQFSHPYRLPLKDSAINTTLKEEVLNTDQLRRCGVLLGSNQAWQHYYNSTFRELINDETFASNQVIYLLLFNFPHLINRHFVSDQSYATVNEPTKDELDDLVEKKDLSLLELKAHVEQGSDNIRNLHAAWHDVYIKEINSNRAESVQSILNALALNPYPLDQYTFFSLVCIRIYKYLNQVSAILVRTLELDPKNHYGWTILADLASYNQEDKKAEKLYNQALLYNPTNNNIEVKIANCYSVQGQQEKAIAIYEKQLDKTNIKDAALFSNYLFSLIHTNIYSAEELFELHKEYGQLVTNWAKQQHWEKTFDNPRTTDRPLRIGFVSGDFRSHPVTKFLLPYWEGLNKEQFHIYAYSNHPMEDSTTDRLKASATCWRNALPLNGLELAKTIHDDQIDILIDLSGHTGYNRLPVFALKPAPVQMTWIGYPATTGLEAMDYKITSAAYAKLDWMQEQFTEKLLYMDVVSAFDNAVQLPAITEKMPCEKNGYFTFASFNRPQKISNEVLKTWAEIMQLCPNDKLLIANMPDDETTTSFKEKLIDFGAQAEQLLFKKRVGLDEYMEMHNEVDLLLDTFPYNGGTTALHSISMGVATVVLAGKSMVSHPHIYYTYDLIDFLAPNIENYKAKALLWRERANELLELKKKMRSKFEEINFNSNDGKNHIKAFSNLLEYAWYNYLENGEARSKVISK